VCVFREDLNDLLVTQLCVGGGGASPENCNEIGGKIKVMAEMDPELLNYEGNDRSSNPCAEPVPVTSDTDYGPLCAELRECLDGPHTGDWSELFEAP